MFNFAGGLVSSARWRPSVKRRFGPHSKLPFVDDDDRLCEENCANNHTACLIACQEDEEVSSCYSACSRELANCLTTCEE